MAQSQTHLATDEVGGDIGSHVYEVETAIDAFGGVGYGHPCSLGGVVGIVFAYEQCVVGVDIGALVVECVCHLHVSLFGIGEVYLGAYEICYSSLVGLRTRSVVFVSCDACT